MIDLPTIEHHVQKHIIDVLMHQRYARFRDMRPIGVDTNLYSYHLKILQKQHIVTKTEEGYTLAERGMVYVDRVTTESLNIRMQPTIITMFVVQNSDGDVLLYRRWRQPFTDLWTLPYGKLHIEDASVLAAAKREVREKLAINDVSLVHAGDCYIRVPSHDNEVMMSTLAHVFRFNSDDIALNDRLCWARPHKITQYDLAPGVEQIITRTFFRDPFYFEEFLAESLKIK